MEAAGEAGRDDPELLAQAAKLLGELRFGVGLGHSLGEASIENVEISGEGKVFGGTIEKASQEANLVGLRPYTVELEGRCLGVAGVVGVVVCGGFCFGDEIRVRVRVRARSGGGGVRGFAFDGEFASRGFEREVRGWELGLGWGWGGVHDEWV